MESACRACWAYCCRVHGNCSVGCFRSRSHTSTPDCCGHTSSAITCGETCQGAGLVADETTRKRWWLLLLRLSTCAYMVVPYDKPIWVGTGPLVPERHHFAGVGDEKSEQVAVAAVALLLLLLQPLQQHVNVLLAVAGCVCAVLQVQSGLFRFCSCYCHLDLICICWLGYFNVRCSSRWPAFLCYSVLHHQKILLGRELKQIDRAWRVQTALQRKKHQNWDPLCPWEFFLCPLMLFLQKPAIRN